MSAHWLNRTLSVLAWAGVFVAGFLTIAHFWHFQIPCSTAGGGCDKVASDPSSKLLGMPVALYGLVGYLFLVMLSAMRTYQSVDRIKPIVKVGMVVAGVGTAFSLYLQYVALVQIKATCLWCIASAVIMTLSLILTALLAQNERLEDLPGNPLDKLTFLGSAALALGVTGILVWMNYAKTLSPGEVLHGNPEVNKVADKPWYFIGPPDADVTIVEWADFYCGACRTTAPLVRDFQRQNPTKVRLAYRSYPIFDKPGHELSLVAAMCAQFAGEHGKYWQFIDLMYDGEATNIGSLTQVYNMLTRVGLNADDARKRIEAVDDTLLEPVNESVKQGESNGVSETPTYIIFAKGQQPVLAKNVNIMRILTSPPVRDIVMGPGK